VQNISRENDLMFMRMNQQVAWNWSIHPRAGSGLVAKRGGVMVPGVPCVDRGN